MCCVRVHIPVQLVVMLASSIKQTQRSHYVSMSNGCFGSARMGDGWIWIHFIRFKLHQWMANGHDYHFGVFCCCCVDSTFNLSSLVVWFFLFMRFCPILVMLKFKHSTISHLYNVSGFWFHSVWLWCIYRISSFLDFSILFFFSSL